MYLGNILKSVNGSYKKIPILGLCFDSRRVKKNYIFFSIKGKKDTGTRYLKEAILNGAAAIVIEKKEKIKKLKIPIVRVENVRKSLSEACSKFYKKKPNFIIAVTGTNGKSSVADFYYQIMSMNKIPTASIGTLGVVSKKYKKKLTLTSEDPINLHSELQILKNKKINKIILEASSHGLDQNRLDYLDFKIGIFTNLSHDHLDYHRSMNSYFNAKMYLFKKLLKKKSKVITDTNIKEFKKIKKIIDKRYLKSFVIGGKNPNLKILNHRYKRNGQIIKITFNNKIYSLEIPLIGYFQVKNLLMAVLAAFHSGLKIKKILNVIKKIKPVPGRLEYLGTTNRNSNIILDFSHTPDALKASLISLKEQFRKKIVLVIGCGGDRDKKKRYIMGKIAREYCEKVYITDDNPRNESPNKIRSDIIKGCKEIAINIGNREKAINSALNKLTSNEILLISGKGHETTQDFGNKVIEFSDKNVVKKIISKQKKYTNNNLDLDANILNYNGVSISSKTIKKNNLFIAIKGKKNNGHNFISEAIKKGAKKVIVSQKLKNIPQSKIIKVPDTFFVLNKLAKKTRQNTNAQILGITGSVGKTTLKNLVSDALKNYGRVHHSPHSYNNKYGVPLSVCNLKSNTDYGVFEIGMDKKGEIDKLSKIVIPEIAVITNISEAHFKNFKTLLDIAKAKGEIINNISSNGFLILNKNCEFFNFFLKKANQKNIKVISFGKKNNSDIFLISIKKLNQYFILKIKVKNKNFYFYSKHKTESYINNILACVSIVYTLGLNLRKMKKTFFNFIFPEGRGDIKTVKKYNKNFEFIDESYNANPLSMTSAIKNINSYKRNKNLKKYIFLGDMLELGSKSKRLHKNLSSVINNTDIDKVFVYGKYIKETFGYISNKKKGKIFNNLKEAHIYFSKIIHNNDLLMVKGSNATGLNQFSKSIKKGSISVI